MNANQHDIDKAAERSSKEWSVLTALQINTQHTFQKKTRRT